MRDGYLAVNSAFAGCIRDVLVLDSDLADFNGVSAYHVGAEMGVCKVEVPDVDGKFALGLKMNGI